MFDINSPNFLGGNNVHNLVQIVLLGAIAYKLFKK
jgi:hypothetical protein